MAKELLIPAERIERSILLIRGQKVMLDSDLAALYGVETRALVQAVKRNKRRFPDDFVFQLTPSDVQILRSQSVISSAGHGGRRTAPDAFTEQGVAMLSSVLQSGRAIEVNIAIMRAFVRLREILATNKDLAAKLAEHDKKLGEHDEKFQVVFEAIRQFMAPPPAQKTPHRLCDHGRRIRDRTPCRPQTRKINHKEHQEPQSDQHSIRSIVFRLNAEPPSRLAFLFFVPFVVQLVSRFQTS